MIIKNPNTFCRARTTLRHWVQRSHCCHWRLVSYLTLNNGCVPTWLELGLDSPVFTKGSKQKQTKKKVHTHDIFVTKSWHFRNDIDGTKLWLCKGNNPRIIPDLHTTNTFWYLSKKSYNFVMKISQDIICNFVMNLKWPI